MREGIKSTEAQVTSAYLLELVDNVGHMHIDMQSTGNNAVLGGTGTAWLPGNIC